MTPLVPLMLYGWPLLGIILFSKMPARRAATIIVVAGTLFLPTWSYTNVPLLPAYDKNASMSLALIFGWMAAGAKERLSFDKLDLPMLLWVFASPVITSVLNGLGLYDGVSGTVSNLMNWGSFYLAGRLAFREPEDLRILAKAIIFGGLLYIPLILFEIRMSPQLCSMIYGFFPHSFAQHVRYGGYRPIIFMDHGLMVALWMSVSTMLAFWMWRSGELEEIKGVPMGLAFFVLAVGTVLCKSANGIVFAIVGVLAYLLWRGKPGPKALRWLLLIVPAYIVFRAQNVVTVEQMIDFLGRIFDPERMESLTVRLSQEDLFGARTRLQPLFGWGGFGRGWPFDPISGQKIGWVDSLWVIQSNTYGYFGLATCFLGLGMGPLANLFAMIRTKLSGATAGHAQDAAALGMVVTIFLLDSLLNGMVNPVYTFCAGALVSYRLATKPLPEGAALSGTTGLAGGKA